jgi:hypothetical protein
MNNIFILKPTGYVDLRLGRTIVCVLMHAPTLLLKRNGNNLFIGYVFFRKRKIRIGECIIQYSNKSNLRLITIDITIIIIRRHRETLNLIPFDNNYAIS